MSKCISMQNLIKIYHAVHLQWRRDARLGFIDLHKFERELQVNVTINSNLLLHGMLKACFMMLCH